MKKILIILAIVFIISTYSFACDCDCMCCKSNFKVGQEVYDITKGQGIVCTVLSDGLTVKFDIKGVEHLRYHYYSDGRINKSDLAPSLYHKKMKIVEDIRKDISGYFDRFGTPKLEELVGKYIHRTAPCWRNNQGGDKSYDRDGLKLIEVDIYTLTLRDTKDKNREIILQRSTWDDGYWVAE